MSVVTVVSINLLLGLGCLWLASRIWRLKCQLSRWADDLDQAERQTQEWLVAIATDLAQGRANLDQLRRQSQSWQLYVKRAQYLLALLDIGRSFVRYHWGQRR